MSLWKRPTSGEETNQTDQEDNKEHGRHNETSLSNNVMLHQHALDLELGVDSDPKGSKFCVHHLLVGF